MDVSKQSFQKLCHPFSFMKCSFFLFIFLLFIIIILGLAAVIVIFIVKPQKPIFSLETLRVVSVDVNAYSNSTLFVSSVISLVLNAQNPNKFGIKFTPARLHVYIEELPVGVIRVPGFNQPARSHNVNVATRVLVHCLNVSQMMSGDQSQDESTQNVAQIKLLGDITLHLQLLHITMPKIKVALLFQFEASNLPRHSDYYLLTLFMVAGFPGM